MFWHFYTAKNLYLLILLVVVPIVLYSFDFMKNFSNKQKSHFEETKLRISEVIEYVYFRKVNGKRIIRETNIMIELFSLFIVSLVLVVGLNTTNLIVAVISSFCSPFIIALLLDRTEHLRYFKEKENTL